MKPRSRIYFQLKRQKKWFNDMITKPITLDLSKSERDLIDLTAQNKEELNKTFGIPQDLFVYPSSEQLPNYPKKGDTFKFLTKLFLSNGTKVVGPYDPPTQHRKKS